jgi:mRNA interferase MazF
MPNQRDIVLVPVPFTDLSATKRRPVLVLSSTAHNLKSPDIVVAAITSNLSAGVHGIVVESADLEKGIMPVRSLIRADKIYTLSRSIVIRTFGAVSPVKFSNVLAEIDKILGR